MDISQSGTGDVVDVLLDQHEQIKTLMAQVANPDGMDRRQSFAMLADLLERHETGEQKVVHAATKHDAKAKDVAKARVSEEKEADHALASLKKLDLDSPEFAAEFAAFQAAVMSHATHEEQEEFPLLREKIDSATLREMAGELREAEAKAL